MRDVRPHRDDQIALDETCDAYVGRLVSNTRSKRSNPSKLRYALLPMLIALSCTVCFAQAVAIEGAVTFSDGEVVKMALISLQNSDGQSDRLTRTDDSGHYVFEEVPPGRYFIVILGGDISTERTGTFFRDDVIIQPGTPSPVTVDAVLEEPS